MTTFSLIRHGETEWNRTGAVPEASPLSAVVWNEAIVVTNGAAVLQRGRDSWQRSYQEVERRKGADRRPFLIL